MNSKISEVAESESYITLLNQVKTDIQQSQLRAAISVTKELILLYWRIGKKISKKTFEEGWGAKTIQRMAKDISSSFPLLSGFSFRNLKYMRQFAESYPEENWAAVVAQIPWGHNIILLEKVNTVEKRLWYAHQTLKNGWSRAILTNWIESGLYSRKGQALTNFKSTLPLLQSDLAEETLKDPYNFSFLGLKEKYEEQELEEGLTTHIQKFLLELGQGFAFVGRQYQIEVSDRLFSIKGSLPSIEEIEKELSKKLPKKLETKKLEKVKL